MLITLRIEKVKLAFSFSFFGMTSLKLQRSNA